MGRASVRNSTDVREASSEALSSTMPLSTRARSFFATNSPPIDHSTFIAAANPLASYNYTFISAVNPVATYGAHNITYATANSVCFLTAGERKPKTIWSLGTPASTSFVGNPAFCFIALNPDFAGNAINERHTSVHAAFILKIGSRADITEHWLLFTDCSSF